MLLFIVALLILLKQVSGFVVAATSNCSNIPASVTYASSPKLPDPFLPLIGQRIATKLQWECRKQEIKQLYQRYELGVMPQKPSSVSASFASNTLKIQVGDGGKTTSWSVSIKYPTSGTAPYPAIIAYGSPSIPIPSTVATITYQNFDVGADNGRGQGKFYDIYGKDHSAGAMIAWAWGVSRIIDAIELTPDTRIDPKRIGVTGCSRNGKGAMIAGAFEDRVALTIPQEGGQASAGCWRIADEIQKNGTKVETAHQIVQGDSWYSTDFSKYVDVVPTLPFDNHFLHSLYASPARGLLIIENTAIDYLGPTSNYHCAVAGRKVFEALSVKDYMGFSQYSHSDHCGFHSQQQPELTAFIERLLLDNGSATDVFKTDGKFVIDEARWVDWSVPSLT